MGSVRRLAHQLGRMVSGRSGGQSAIDSRDRDALSRWESEGGAGAAVRVEEIDAVRKGVEDERANRDNVTGIDEDDVGEAASVGGAKDALADVASNPTA